MINSLTGGPAGPIKDNYYTFLHFYNLPGTPCGPCKPGSPFFPSLAFSAGLPLGPGGPTNKLVMILLDYYIILQNIVKR